MEELIMIKPSKEFLDSLEKQQFLEQKEQVLNADDTANILKAVDIVKDVKPPNLKELKIKLDTRLDVSADEEIAIRNFTHALKQLPKQVNFELGIEGRFNDFEQRLKLNLETFVVDMVKEHFKEE
jgi:hypothetical protein